MTPKARNTKALTGYLRVALAALSLFSCALAITYLGSDLRNQIDALATANTDNRQWSLIQGEVEHDSFTYALIRAELSTTPEEELFNVRRRFDIFYSRVQLFQSAPQFATLRSQAEVTPHLGNVRRFLEGAIPVIDADDAELIANLRSLRSASDAVKPDVRGLMLAGLRVATDETERRRIELSGTLIRLGSVLAGVVLMLLISVLVLMRLLQIGRGQEHAQELARERLAAIAEASLDAIIVADQQGRVIEYNDAAVATFGYEKAEAVGAELSKLIIPQHLVEAHEMAMTRHLSTGEKRVIGKGRLRLDAKHKMGHIFPVELSISAARSEGGEIFISFLRDISTRVKAESDLLEARDRAVAGERAKARLLAVMSHEMRTPLNGVLGALDLIDTTKTTEQQQSYLDIMRDSGSLLLSHVNNVLEISRLDAGQVEVAQTPFNLEELLLEVCSSQSAVAKARNNLIRCEMQSDGLGAVKGDPARIRQVVMNLLGNAVKFTKNGEIHIEAQRIGQTETVEIRVVDTGIGIAPENMERVFDDFVTLDSNYNRDADGTGLGLGIVRRQTEVMKGTIGLESEPGEGTLFWVRLPLPITDETVLPRNAGNLAADQPEVTRPIKILLVEDNLVNRKLAADMLKGMGHFVTDVEDGQLAVEAAEAQKFDLILMDISMPRMDGARATELILGGDGPNIHTPVVALTAHALPDEIERFQDIGMTQTILKPISRGSLSILISSIFSETAPPPDRLSPKRTRSPIDKDLVLRLRRDITTADFDRLMGAFQAEMSREIAALDPQAAGEAPADWARKAHKLAGSAATFGAAQLREKLNEIESNIKSGTASDPTQDIDALRSIWQDCLGAFDQLLNDAADPQP